MFIAIANAIGSNRRISDLIKKLIDAFKTRVLADGGTFEAEQCLKDSLPALIENEPSILVTPNAVEEGTLFSIIPADGSGDMDVVRATTATRVNESGLIESVGLNVPRLDYTNGSCPSILVEPQRTNLFTYSEQFDDASWSKVRINAFGSGSIANATTSPDGTMTADYIQQETGQTIKGGVYKVFTTVSGTVYTLSVFAKKSDSNFLQLAAAWITAGDYAEFNLDTGTIGTVASGLTARIVDFGNGWYRCSITGASAFSGTRAHIIYQNAVPTAVPDTGIYIWGAQLEAGSNATSYIPTTTSAVTRNVDIGVGTMLSNIQSKNILSTNGTIFWDTDLMGINTTRTIFNLSSFIGFISLGDGRTGLRYNSFGTYGALTNRGTGRLKIIVAYSGLNLKCFINGTLAGDFTMSSTVSPDILSIFHSSFGIGVQQEIKQVLMFNNMLTDTECIALTTL